MKREEITRMNVGEDGKLDRNTTLVQFDPDKNDALFWRVHGDVVNEKCTIVVPPTHQAVYIKDGVLQDVLVGGRYPVFQVAKRGFFGLGKKMDAAVIDVIFMNRTIKYNALWGTSTPAMMRDPITEQVVHVTGYGEFEVGIADAKQFYLQIVGAEKLFDLESLNERLSARMMSYFNDALAKIMHDKIETYLDIQTYRRSLGEDLVPYLNELFVRDCGLYVHSFTISELGIQEDEEKAIEKELEARRRELKEKKDAKELVAELERLEDRANARKDYEEECKWKRELILKELEAADKEKYYDVLKILAENSRNHFGNLDIKDNVGLPERGGRFCTSCGAPYVPGAKFCAKCGERLPGGKITCPKCGKTLDSGSKFCPECGERL